MDDHRPTTRRRGRYRRRQQLQRAANTPAHSAAAPATARDGGHPMPQVTVSEPLISREEDGIRRGPYEDSYSITHGYGAG